MIKIKIEEKEFTVKSDWNEVTFEEFTNYMDITKDTYSEVMKLVKIISAFSDAANKSEFEKIILKLNIEDFNSLKAAFAWISEDITLHPEYKKKNLFFEIEGVKYKIKEKYNEFSVGEMVTLETLLRDKTIDANQYELSFAILFRKLDENEKETEFNMDDFLFVLKHMKDKVKAIDVISHINFFLLGDKTSMAKNSQGTSSLQILKMNTEECPKKKSKSTKKKSKRT